MSALLHLSLSAQIPLHAIKTAAVCIRSLHKFQVKCVDNKLIFSDLGHNRTTIKLKRTNTDEEILDKRRRVAVVVQL